MCSKDPNVSDLGPKYCSNHRIRPPKTHISRALGPLGNTHLRVRNWNRFGGVLIRIQPGVDTGDHVLKESKNNGVAFGAQEMRI